MLIKAAVLRGIKDITCQKLHAPKAQADEEMIRVASAGICGSDVDRVFGKGAYHYPIILGHEFSGYRMRDNKKVVVFPLIPCMKCSMCMIGEYASCLDYNYYGSRTDGGFREQIAVKKWNIIEAPDESDTEALAMAEPAAVALHAIDMLGIKVGQSILITGAGPIGMMLGQWAKISGAHKIYFSDIDNRKLDFANEYGFLAYNGEAVDAAVEGVGVSSSLVLCLEALKPKGGLVLMGNPIGEINLSQNEYWHILRKQLTLRGTWNSTYNKFRNEWQVAVDAIASGVLDVKPLITHRFGLEDCERAFKVMYDRTEFVNRVMFSIG